jgi:hypothetical protein
VVSNRPSGVNRFLLTVLGLVLLAGAAFTLLSAFDVLNWVPDDATVIPAGIRLLPWVPYVVVAAAIVLALLCLLWLAAQGRRRPRTHTWRLDDDPDSGITRLSADVAVDPLVAEVEDLPGLRAAAAWLPGSPDGARLILRVRTEHDTDITALRASITTEAVPRLREALELSTLPTTVEFVPTAATTRTR